ncbi:l alanyl d glutamate peptidase endolysin [Caudoviricetes sp.]|nr:l alanyl d glutamate peptidase endolysin [Caudoviricetes sp.]
MVVEGALEISKVDFCVTEGLRTLKKQEQLYKTGASKTMNSRHLTGHAVDLAPYIGGQVRFDWPPFYEIARAMKTVAEDLEVDLEWGGSWKFKDGPHFQLSWAKYPVNK